MAPDWGSEPEDQSEVVDLNLTSLVDVVLVLLVVFMVSTSAIVDRDRLAHAEGRVDLQLPAGNQLPSDRKPAGELSLQIDSDGLLFVDGAPTDWQALRKDLVERLGKDADLQVRVDADQRLPVSKAVEVLDQLQNLGIRNVGLGTKAK